MRNFLTTRANFRELCQNCDLPTPTSATKFLMTTEKVLVPSYLLTIFALTTAYPNSFPTAWQWTGGVGCMVFLLAAASIYSRLKYSFADNTDDTKTAIKVKGVSEILLLTSAAILASGLSYRAFSIVFFAGLLSLMIHYALPKKITSSFSHLPNDRLEDWFKNNGVRTAFSFAMLLSSAGLLLYFNGVSPTGMLQIIGPFGAIGATMILIFNVCCKNKNATQSYQSIQRTDDEVDNDRSRERYNHHDDLHQP